MADSARVSSSLRSGLTGGAATGTGAVHQTYYAVYIALRLIARLLSDSPVQRPLLSIEPRLLSKSPATSGQLTRWDIQVSPDCLAIEAKANAGKADLIEFLERCRRSVAQEQDQSFELVYGVCCVGFLKAIEKLMRLAEEAGDDSCRFDNVTC